MSLMSSQVEAIFKPRARLLRLLGESLLRDEVVALIELVKNAHDADASVIRVELHNVRTKEGRIIITDDGCGMTLEKVLGVWMELGTEDKRRTKYTPSGRRVLGEKGIGRFAADKLAERLELITKTDKSDKEVYAVFDWSKFDDAVYLDEVRNHIEEREPKIIQKHGTTLILSRLRTSWTRAMANKLHIGLLRLVSPFRKVKSFEIRLFSNDYPHLEGELRNEIFEKAPYRIKAEVKSDGKIICEINDTEIREFNYIRDKKKVAPECGPFKVELYAWELTAPILKVLSIGVTGARKLIKAWSGVNIYRDSFRVLPYGEMGEDWLELDRRRIDEPAVRFSRNQILGFVHIGSEINPNLIDQTNREGLIQNRAFHDLRRCVLQIIRPIENYRLELKKEEKKKKEKREETAGEIFDGILDRLSAVQDPAKEIVVESVYEAKDILERREEETAEVVSRFYRHLAIGEMANNIIHELKQPATTIVFESESGLIVLSRKPVKHDFIKDSLEIVKERGIFINRIVEKWTPFIRSRRQAQKFNICDAIKSAFSDFRKEIARNNVRVEYPDPKSSEFEVEMDYADAVIIFENLLNNSLYWLEVSGASEPRIQVSAKTRGREVVILFADNGPGVKQEYCDKIFLPGWTLKEEGAGLGLSIIGEIIDDYEGRIELLSPYKDRKGAQFKIVLPLA